MKLLVGGNPTVENPGPKRFTSIPKTLRMILKYLDEYKRIYYNRGQKSDETKQPRRALLKNPLELIILDSARIK